MALKQSSWALGLKTSTTVGGSELGVCRAEYTLTGDLAANDIIEMMALPPNCVPVDIIMDCDDMDTGATGTAAAGLLNSGKTDLDSTWLAASSIQSAGAFRADAAGLRAMSRLAATNGARPVGIKIVGEPAAAAGQVIGLTLLYRAAQ